MKRFALCTAGTAAHLLVTIGTAACLLVTTGTAALAQAPLRVLRPVSGAIVRETVPVKIASGDLPPDGYVAISLDGKFRTARVLPDNKNSPVYELDTKAPFATPDDTAAKTYLGDGPHTLTIKLYDRAGKNLGEKTIALRVANKIPVPAQGIKLAYRWRADQHQKFSRSTELDSVVSGGPDQPLQSSNVVFTRTVEDVSGGSYLIRDRVLPVSTLTKDGSTQSLAALYMLKSKYRTVDTRGDVLGSMAPLSAGDHFAFSIPVLSARRVSVGDSWQAPVEMSLEWAASPPATVQAESRLEGYEWQDGYPTAKIRETFSGAVTFNLASSVAAPISATAVNYERVIYFAYGAGRVVRMETNMTVTTDAPLSGLGTASNGPQGPQFSGPQYNGPPPGAPGSPGYIPPPPPPQVHYGPGQQGNDPSQPNYNPYAPGGPQYTPSPGYDPGSPSFAGQPSALQAAPVSNNYKVTETTTQTL